jgi:hypothetical protein
VWRRRRKAVSAGLSAAPYSAHHKLYSEAVVSSAASAVALAEVGQFKEAVQYVQRVAKALYEAAKEVFEQVKVAAQRLVELFVEAVTRVLAWMDEHKAYLFLMAAAAAGVVALSAALNPWGLIELEKLAYAASLTPFVTTGVREYPREEVFNMLKAPDPYEKFKKIARGANAEKVKLAEPWESLRMLILPKPSEEEKLMSGRGAELYSKYRKDENYRRALFYATLALEEAFGVYRSVFREVGEGLREAVEKREVGEGPFKRVVYMADLGRLAQLAEKEETAFESALSALRKRLNEYAVKYSVRDLLDVNEDVVRRLAEAKHPELPELNDVSFGVKALAALIAYREYELGRRGVFGKAAWHWLEGGGSAWLLYYAPSTAYEKAERAGVERPVAVEELVAEALRRLFLKPGADHHRGFVEELTKGGKLALVLEDKTKSSYVFRLFRLEEGDKLKELEGVRLRISMVGDGIIYALEFEDVERWPGFFKQALEAGVKAAEEVKERLPVEDRLLYMLGWVDSDVAISGGRLEVGTSHLWQLAETKALFDWSDVTVRGVNLTLEGPKPLFRASTSLDRLNDAIRISAEGGWLHMLGTKAGLEDLMHVKSWDDLKRWVAKNWDVVVDAAVSRLREVLKEEELRRLLAQVGGDVAKRRKGGQEAPRGKQIDGENVWEELRRRLEALRDLLNDDKIAREVVAPALLLIQAERLGVNETTLRYFAAVASGAIDGDGHVSAVMGEVGLTRGKLEDALFWAAVFAAHGIKAKVKGIGSALQVIVSGDDAVKLAGLYFLYGHPLLEGDERLKSHKLAEAVRLGAEGLDIRWEGLREIKGGAAADLIILEGGAAVKYNVYLRSEDILLQFRSTDRSRVELAARLLGLAGVSAEVKKEGVSDRDKWYVIGYTDMLAAGHEGLRKALAEIVREAVARGWVDEKKAERWLKKLERGLVLKEGWPMYLVKLKDGALMLRFSSTDRDSIEREKQRLENMGLEEGKHFTVKMPEGGERGYVSILRKGLEHAAWLSVHGSGEQQRLAAGFVERILQRAWEAGEEVYEKASKIVEEGRSRGSLKLEGFEKKVKVGGREHVVKVIGGGAEFDKSEGGKPLLIIRITAEVDGVRREYKITYSRHVRTNKAEGRAAARADAPGGREADAERLSALVEALTGRRPRVYRMKDGTIIIMFSKKHLEGFKRYAELADVIERWLEETSRR